MHSLLNRSIQDLSDHGASKERTNPAWKWIRKETKCKIRFCILSDIRIQSWIFLKKCTLSLSFIVTLSLIWKFTIRSIKQCYWIHTPYSKMAAVSDDLGRVAWKRGIEGQTPVFTNVKCRSRYAVMPQNCCVPECKKKVYVENGVKISFHTLPEERKLFLK